MSNEIASPKPAEDVEAHMPPIRFDPDDSPDAKADTEAHGGRWYEPRS